MAQPTNEQEQAQLTRQDEQRAQQEKQTAEQFEQMKAYLREMGKPGESTLARLERLDGPVAAYPAGDRERYRLPLSDDGRVIPSREGKIHSVDREHGVVTVQHVDGTISRYEGMQQISGNLQVGQDVTRDQSLGQPNPQTFHYQRYREGPDGQKSYLAPGVSYDLAVHMQQENMARANGHSQAAARDQGGQINGHAYQDGGTVDPSRLAERVQELAAATPGRQGNESPRDPNDIIRPMVPDERARGQQTQR